MEVLLVLNDGFRVVLKLHTSGLKEEFTDLLSHGRREEVIRLLKSKAEVKGPLPEGERIPPRFKPFLIIEEI